MEAEETEAAEEEMAEAAEAAEAEEAEVEVEESIYRRMLPESISRQTFVPAVPTPAG